LDTGLSAVVPAWGKLIQAIEHQIILQKLFLVDCFVLRRLAVICHPSVIVFTSDSMENQAILYHFLDQLPFTPPIAKIILPNIGRWCVYLV
jgi:hypothetical protein